METLLLWASLRIVESVKSRWSRQRLSRKWIVLICHISRRIRANEIEPERQIRSLQRTDNNICESNRYRIMEGNHPCLCRRNENKSSLRWHSQSGLVSRALMSWNCKRNSSRGWAWRSLCTLLSVKLILDIWLRVIFIHIHSNTRIRFRVGVVFLLFFQLAIPRSLASRWKLSYGAAAERLVVKKFVWVVNMVFKTAMREARQ